MRARTILAAGLATAIAATGCDDDDGFDAIVAFGPDLEDVVGFWTGVEEITGAGGAAAILLIGDQYQSGFRFPVALELRIDRSFVLRSFAVAVRDAGENDRVCTGVYAIDGNTLKFFPNELCRPLPLSAYTIGRFAPDGLILEANTRAPVLLSGDPAVGDIRVRIRVERD